MTAIAQEANESSKVRFNPWVALLMGVVVGTFAAPFIKLAQQGGLPSPVIASTRMFVAALVLTPFVLKQYRPQLKALTRRDLVMTMFAGLMLQLHFQFMIFALELTTTLIVLVITNTSPLWVAALERIFLKERLNRLVLVGMFITIFGSVFIAINSLGGGAGTSSNPLLGAISALLAALAAASNLTVGRSVRQKVSLFPYIWIVFGFGGILGLIFVGFAGIPLTGHPMNGYFWLVMLILLPQLIGHSAFNFALGYITATIISLSSQLLTITASIVAYFIFAEIPTISDFIGSIIIAIGVLIAIFYRNKGKVKPIPSSP
ncbi:MAG: DMT family transporter [Phototrophicaceae bacterium]